MNESDRERIKSNLNNLIRFTRYRELINYCLEEKLLYPIMAEEIEKCIENEVKHKLLFEKIMKRGPKAYDVLLNICRQHFPEAAFYLERGDYNMNNNEIVLSEVRYQITNQNYNTNNNNDSSFNSFNSTSEIILKPYTLDVEPKLNLTVKKSKKIHIHETLPTYDMKSKNRGVFFLVNIIHFSGHEPRGGAQIDRDNLISLFRQMNFEIYYYEDITVNELTQLIGQLRNSKVLRNTDCLVFTLLTHGKLKDSQLFAQFTDLSYISIYGDVIRSFNNENCSSLVGKPKIFILPFCRGDRPDAGVKAKRLESDSIVPIAASSDYFVNIATLCDVKICYATVPGYSTFRDPVDGSWYVEVMCKIWAEHAHDKSLDDLLIMVGGEVSRRRTADTNELQTECNENRGFHKVLYFNPGYYEEN